MGGGSSKVSHKEPQPNDAIFDDLQIQIQQLFKYNLGVKSVKYNGTSRNEVCETIDDAVRVIRFVIAKQLASKDEHKVESVTENTTNDLFVFVIQHQDKFSDILLSLKLGKRYENQMHLERLKAILHEASHHTISKEKSLYIKCEKQHLAVHLVAHKCDKDGRRNDKNQIVHIEKLQNGILDDPLSTAIIVTVCSFIRNADTIIRAIDALISDTARKEATELTNDNSDDVRTEEVDENIETKTEKAGTSDQKVSRANSDKKQSAITDQPKSQLPPVNASESKTNTNVNSKNTSTGATKPSSKPTDKTTGIKAKPIPNGIPQANQNKKVSAAQSKTTTNSSKKDGPKQTNAPSSKHNRAIPPPPVSPRQVHVKEADYILTNKDESNAKEKKKAEDQSKVIRDLKASNKDLKSELEVLRREMKEEKTKLENKITEANKAKTKIASELSKVQKAKNDIDQKHHEQNSTISDLETDKSNLTKKKDDLFKENLNLKQKLDKMKRETEVAESEMQKRNRETIELKDTNADLIVAVESLQAKLQDMTNRLATEMNTKISADESALENISIRCRPMNVADDFNTLTSNAWLDAKECLDKIKMEEDKSVTFLCEILMISASTAHALFSNGIDFLINPFGKKQVIAEKTVRDKSKTNSDSIISAVGDNFRRHVEQIDITPLKNKILQLIPGRTQLDIPNIQQLLEISGIDKYAEACALLAWKMAIQRPPMTFDQPDVDEPFQGEHVHPLAWGSKPGQDAKIRYYQYPTLLHGDKVMVKGKVFVS